MHHEYLISYFLIQTKVMKTTYPAMKESQDKEAIHDFRVACKRMNAVYYFLEFINPIKFKQKISSAPYKKIFKLSGNIRELQLHQEMLIRYQQLLNVEFPLYHLYLKELEKKEDFKFTAWLASFQFPYWEFEIDKINKLIGTFSEYDLVNYGNQYVNEKIIEVSQLCQLTSDENIFHEVRITLKKLRFVLEINVAFCPTGIENRKLIRLLKKTEQYLGNWHDRILILEHFNDYRIKGGMQLFPPVEDVKNLNEIIGNEKKELLLNATKKLEMIIRM